VNVAMFGMNDPAQTLLQLERYIEDGRMEMSEVMATQFTEMFLSQKKRTADAQIMLVKGLRILCDVFLARGKLQRAIASVKTLHRERKKLIRLLAKSAPHLLEKMTAPAEDYRRAGKIYATAGKNGAAMKAFSKCEKLSPGHVASAMEACTLLGFDKKRVNRFLNTIQAAGPVILSSGRFQLQPPHLPEADAHEVMAILQSAVDAGIGSTDVCQKEVSRISEEIGAIERGEAAANARLQAAMDLLKPQHDYYKY
tara:strand:+ start:2021 stop:2782 length:762 start_codon:yes stop_codon:yes gene_type:complete